MARWKQYQAGGFLVDASDRTVRQGDQTSVLSPKEFRLFELLAESPGEIVEKEQLLSALWPDVQVSERNLTQHIYCLRSIFGNDAIQTVAKRGYRLALAVKSVEPEEPAAVRPATRSWRPVYAWGILGSLAVVLLLAAARSRQPAPDAVAYDLYLRAQSHLEASDRQNIPGALRESERNMAVDLLGKAIERDPAFADAHGLLARAWCELNLRAMRTEQFLARSEESMRRAFALDGNNLHALTARVCLAHTRGRPEEALEVASRIRAMKLHSAAAANAAGSAFHRIGLVQAAADEFEKAVRMSPRTLTYRESWAYALLQAGQSAKCVDVLSPVLKTEEGGFWHGLVCLKELGRWEEAIATGQKSLAANQEGPMTYRELAMAYRGAGREREARELLERAVRHFEGRYEGEPSGRNAIFLSMLCAHLGRVRDTKIWVDRALEQEPGQVMWIVHAGIALAILGEDDGALKYFEKAYEAGFASRPLLDWQIKPEMGSPTLRDRPEFQALRKRLDARLSALQSRFQVTASD